MTPKLAMTRAALAKEKGIVRLRDANGQEHEVDRREWREKILPKNIADAWPDAEQLTPILLHALTEGIYKDILEAAEHLRRIDLHTERSAVVMAILYIKLHRPEDAERVLKEEVWHLKKTGGYLTSLTKLSRDQQNAKLTSRYDRSIATMARGIE